MPKAKSKHSGTEDEEPMGNKPDGGKSHERHLENLMMKIKERLK